MELKDLHEIITQHRRDFYDIPKAVYIPVESYFELLDEAATQIPEYRDKARIQSFDGIEVLGVKLIPTHNNVVLDFKQALRVWATLKMSVP